MSATLSLVTPALTQAQLTVLGETVHERKVRAGDEIIDSVLLANPTDRPLRARIYLTDYVFNAHGETRYDAGPSHARSNADWVVLSAEFVTVAPHASLPIRYRLRVPVSTDAQAPDRTGSYWSMLMIEGVNAESDRAASALGLQTAIRYGIQLVSHLPALGVQNASITAPRMLRTDSAPTASNQATRVVVEFDLTNTGDRAFRPVLTLELYDARGRKHGPYKRTRGLLFPTTGLRQRFDLENIDPGEYDAVILVDTGLEEMFAVRVKLRI